MSRTTAANRPAWRVVVSLVLLAPFLAAVATLASVPAAPPAAALTPGSLAYTPAVAPVAAFAGEVGEQGAGSVGMAVAGMGGVPTGVGAVAVNVVVEADHPTEVRVFSGALPAAPATPTVVLTRPGRVAGFTTVTVPTGGPSAGLVRVWNATGTAQVTVHVVGWFSTDATTAGAFVPLPGASAFSGRVTLGALGARNVTVTGVAGVPAERVRAVVVRAVARPTAPGGPAGELRVFAADALTLPDASTVAVGDREAANVSIVRVSSGGTTGTPYGQIRLWAGGQALDVDLEVLGWIDLTQNPAGYVPAPNAPLRILDTAGTQRNTVDLNAALPTLHTGPLAPSPGKSGTTPTGDLELKVSPSGLDAQGWQAVPPTNVSSVAVQVRVSEAAGPTRLWVYPSGSPPADGATLATDGSDAVAFAVVKLGSDGRLRLRTDAAAVRVTVDVVGWFDAEYQDRGPLVHGVYNWRFCNYEGRNCLAVNKKPDRNWTTNRDCSYSVPTIDGRRFWVFCDTGFHQTVSPYYVMAGGFPTNTAGVQPTNGAYGEVNVNLVNGNPQWFIPRSESFAGVECVPGEYGAVWPRSVVSMPGVRPDGSQTIMIFYQSACVAANDNNMPIYRHGSVGVARFDYRPGDPRLTDPPTSSERVQAVPLSSPAAPAGALFTPRPGESFTYEFGGIVDRGYLYLYECGDQQPCHVARFNLWGWTDAKIADPTRWEYLATSGAWLLNPNAAPTEGPDAPAVLWDVNPDDASSMVGAGVFVNRANGKLVMSHMAAPALGEPFDRLATVRIADSPVGPWRVAGTFLLPGCARTVAELPSGRPVGCYAPTIQWGHPDQGLRLAVTFYNEKDLTVVMPDGTTRVLGQVRRADMTLRGVVL